jgi:hypothetical protein
MTHARALLLRTLKHSTIPRLLIFNTLACRFHVPVFVDWSFAVPSFDNLSDALGNTNVIRTRMVHCVMNCRKIWKNLRVLKNDSRNLAVSHEPSNVRSTRSVVGAVKSRPAFEYRSYFQFFKPPLNSLILKKIRKNFCPIIYCGSL